MNQQHNPPLASCQAGSSCHFAGDQPSSSPLTVSVIDPQFCAQENYIMELTITKDDDGKLVFAKDVAGNIVFQITDDKHIRLHKQRLILLDPAGNPLVTLQRKICTAHNKWEVFKGCIKPSKDLLFRTTRPSSNQNPVRILDVFLATNSVTVDDVCDFKVTGSWLEGSCNVYTRDSNNIIAQISKKPMKGSVSPGKDSTLTVKVYPNIDYAFIVSLVVILDAIYTDDKSTRKKNKAEGGPKTKRDCLDYIVAGATIIGAGAAFNT